MSSRECGECTACCTHLKIDTAELQKLADVDCEHLEPQRGCRIYASRPRGCRDFVCAWHQMPDIPDDWRPDRSGVLLVLTGENIPSGYATDYGIKVQFIRAPGAQIRNPGVVRAILSFVHARIPVFLSLQGPVGLVAKRMLLNPRLQPFMAAGEPEALIGELAEMLQALEREPKEAVVFVHRRGPAAAL